MGVRGRGLEDWSEPLITLIFVMSRIENVA